MINYASDSGASNTLHEKILIDNGRGVGWEQCKTGTVYSQVVGMGGWFMLVQERICLLQFKFVLHMLC